MINIMIITIAIGNINKKLKHLNNIQNIWYLYPEAIDIIKKQNLKRHMKTCDVHDMLLRLFRQQQALIISFDIVFMYFYFVVGFFNFHA